MNRKLLVLTLVIMLITGLSGSHTFSVHAGSQPPPPRMAPQRLMPQHAPGRSVPPALNPQVTLGQPGLSFRYVGSYGELDVPYFADATHLNRPNGLFIDGSNNIYITEDPGYRVLKYNSAGGNLLALGKPGVCYTDDTNFCVPQDVVADGSGNFWVADGNRVVQYNASGLFLQQFPQTEPWLSGSDNTHFEGAAGVALDAAEHLFVSDRYNHRIQVFDLQSGSPVYSTTIGVTGLPGSLVGYFDEPTRIAVDSNNRLLVADSNNNRVQRCSYSAGWSCVVYDSNLNGPNGIAVDGSGNVYIADTFNGRIRKCTGPGACSDFVSGTYWLLDVAVDSNGDVYGTAPGEDVVARYDNNGNEIGYYLGVFHQPYLTDAYHYNHPRVAIDPGDNIILLEEQGQRLVKLDPQGNFLWAFGVPGVDWSEDDNDHFNWPHAVAMDNNSNIYVADNCRVQIFNPAGVFQRTLGTGCGSGNYQFGWAAGIAVDGNGNIYVSDYPNHRVQIYNTSLTYIGRIGVTGVCDAANDHLCNPLGVDVDTADNIYVADAGNSRVQKFNSSLTWLQTIGDTGRWGSDYGQFDWAEDVAVDQLGKIYVADWGNQRVQVFDSSGAFLTSIGGAWGTNSSQFRGVSSVDVDSYGNVYVSDWENARIQKFSPGVLGWIQKNINGFGDPSNTIVTSLEVFNNQFYAGTANWNAGGTIWRSSDGSSWSPVTQPGFGSTYTNTNPSIPDMIVFNGQLYAGTGWDGIGGQVWRSPDGNIWSEVVDNGFANINNGAIDTFAVFANALYACTDNPQAGLEIWRSVTGNLADWIRVVDQGFDGNPRNIHCTGFTVFNGYLYTVTESSSDNQDGVEIWRTNNGNNWYLANITGFGDVHNFAAGGFAIYQNELFVGIRNDVTGGQIWRSGNGTSWIQVIGDGFGNVNSNKVETLFVFGDNLYAGVDNEISGLEFWRTTDGIHWSQINPNGFGDSNNIATVNAHATEVFRDNLYMGTVNFANGGEIWQLQRSLYIPVVQR